MLFMRWWMDVDTTEAEMSKGANCEVCGVFIPDYEPQYCCRSFDCGCGGRPIDPCVCGDECYDKLLSKMRSNNERS